MDIKSVFILIVLIGLIPAMIAYYKGHNFWKWWMLGTGLFIAALPIVVFLKPVRHAETLVEVDGMKKCLYCTEMVRMEAVVCPFCGHHQLVSSDLAEQVGIAGIFDRFSIRDIQKQNLVQGIIFAAIVLLIFAMTLLMLANLKY